MAEMCVRSQDAQIENTRACSDEGRTRRVHFIHSWCCAPHSHNILSVLAQNPKKIMDVGISRLGARMTMSRSINLYKLPDRTATPGFRKMGPHDVPAVAHLLRNYLIDKLPPSILGGQNYSVLKVAYSYYNVSTKTPLLQLTNNALIVAKEGFDVYNALDDTFFKELKFDTRENHFSD